MKDEGALPAPATERELSQPAADRQTNPLGIVRGSGPLCLALA